MKHALIALCLMSATGALAQDQKADEQRVLQAIDAFTTMQAKTDPHFAVVEGELLKELDHMLGNNPPREWLPIIRRRYVALSEAEHAKERDTIRAEEAKVAAGLGTGEAGWGARSAQLEQQLKAGTLGPRLHALRLSAAARIYHPGNETFVMWRAAKVPIATDYELGNISRTEYEARWQRVTQTFLDRQSADDRFRASIQAQAAGEEYRAARESIRPTPRLAKPIRCTTSTNLGVTTTSCN